MYNICKRKCIRELTVKELIEILKDLPQDAKVLYCGDSIGYIHIENDESIINIDTEDLDSEYSEDPQITIEDYWKCIDSK